MFEYMFLAVNAEDTHARMCVCVYWRNVITGPMGAFSEAMADHQY